MSLILTYEGELYKEPDNSYIKDDIKIIPKYNYKDINYLDKIDKLQSIGVTNYKIILDRENIEEIKLIISALKIKENIL